jgi:hypothetical protein
MLLHIMYEVDGGLLYFLESAIGAITTREGEAKSSILLGAILLGGILVIKHLLNEIKGKVLRTRTLLLLLLGWLRLFLLHSRLYHREKHVLW